MFHSALLIIAFLWIGNAENTTDYDLWSGTLQTISSQIFGPNSMKIGFIANIAESFSADLLNVIVKANMDMWLTATVNNLTTVMDIKQRHDVLVLVVYRVNVFMRTFQTDTWPESMNPQITKFFIMMRNPHKGRQSHLEMQSIFENFFNIYAINVNIFIMEDGALNIYTYYPYSRRCCNCVKVRLLQSFRAVPRVLNLKDIFPEKLGNFYGCPLRAVTWHNPPFLALKWNARGDQMLSGFDGNLLRELASMMNFTIQLVPNEPPEQLGGIIFANKTATGAFKMLVERRANVTLGCTLCKNNQLGLISNSVPYFMLQYVIILRNNIKHRPIDLLLKPFSQCIWYLIVIVVLLRVLWAHLLAAKLTIRPPFRRFFILLWIYFIFILKASYEGSMFQIITNPPYEPMPLTITEVFHKNYTVYSDYDTARNLFHLPLFAKNVKVMQMSPMQMMEMLDSLPQKSAILTTSVYVVTYLGSRLEKRGEYTLVKQRIFNNMNCVFFAKHSYLMPAFTQNLNQIIKHGVKQKYLNEIPLRNLPPTTDKLQRATLAHDQELVNFNFLRDIFKTFCFMSGASFCVLILEIIIARLNDFRRNRRK